MYLEDKIELEEKERERRYQEEIGWFGRLIDNDWVFVLIFALLFPTAGLVGLLIGRLLW